MSVPYTWSRAVSSTREVKYDLPPAAEQPKRLSESRNTLKGSLAGGGERNVAIGVRQRPQTHLVAAMKPPTATDLDHVELKLPSNFFRSSRRARPAERRFFAWLCPGGRPSELCL